jgi:hypothetical protein
VGSWGNADQTGVSEHDRHCVARQVHAHAHARAHAHAHAHTHAHTHAHAHTHTHTHTHTPLAHSLTVTRSLSPARSLSLSLKHDATTTTITTTTSFRIYTADKALNPDLKPACTTGHYRAAEFLETGGKMNGKLDPTSVYLLKNSSGLPALESWSNCHIFDHTQAVARAYWTEMCLNLTR